MSECHPVVDNGIEALLTFFLSSEMRAPIAGVNYQREEYDICTSSSTNERVEELIGIFSFSLHFVVMSVLFAFLVLLSTSHISSSWPMRRARPVLTPNDTCCILAKLNINATRANQGRAFFSQLIFHNQSYKDVNENNVCSLMHFFMQEALLNGRPIKFSKGFSRPWR